MLGYRCRLSSQLHTGFMSARPEFDCLGDQRRERSGAGVRPVSDEAEEFTAIFGDDLK